jgi:hypothetical protein
LINEDWNTIKEKLNNFSSTSRLKPVFELDIREERNNLPQVEEELREIISNGIKVLKRKVTSIQVDKEEVKNTTAINIEELSPHLILEHIFETKNYTDEEKIIIRETFSELLEIVNEKEE